MKEVKSRSKLFNVSIWFTAFAFLLLVFNMLCNKSALGIEALWNVSAYFFALLIGPVSMLYSVTVSVILGLNYSKFKIGIIVASFALTVFNIIINLIGYLPGSSIYTWH